MPLTILPTNAIAVVYFNQAMTGFEIFTLAVTGVRHFRLSWEDSNGLLKYYYFSFDLSGLDSVQPTILEIPFDPAKFVEDTNDVFSGTVSNFDDLASIQGVQGSSIPPGIFKLFYMENAATGVTLGNFLPANIDLKATYSVGTMSIRFVYYRVSNERAFYTGVFGDKAYDNEYNSLADLTGLENESDVIVLREISGVFYFFVRLSGTPNILVSGSGSGGSDSSRPTDIVETYSGQNNNYQLTHAGQNVLAGTNTFKVAVSNKETSQAVQVSDFTAVATVTDPSLAIVPAMSVVSVTGTGPYDVVVGVGCRSVAPIARVPIDIRVFATGDQ